MHPGLDLCVLDSLNWVSKSTSVTSGTTSSRTLLSKVPAFAHGGLAKKNFLRKRASLLRENEKLP